MKLSAASVIVPAVWLLWPSAAGSAAAQPAAPLHVAHILSHLARSISWYRHMTAVEQSASLSADLLLRDSPQRTSTRALQLAFDFARAAAPLVSAEAPAGGRSLPAGLNVEQASMRAVERVATFERQIAEVDAAIEKAGPRTRATLIARRKALLAELNLAKEIRDSVKGFRTFLRGQATGSGSDLPGYIDRLERTVPETMRGAQSPTAEASAPAATPLFRPETGGIFGLVTETIRMARSKSQIGDALAETDTLRKNLDEIRTPLVSEMRSTIRRSDADASDSESQDAGQMESGRQEIEALTARFKQVSAALAPLREQVLLTESVRGSLLEWRDRVQQRYSAAGSYLFFRVLALSVTILAVLGISELWRRGTFRYVRDARRRKQFLVLRRVTVSFAVVVMILLGLASEVGSLATYAGLLTAGLAVALQNVILSIVGYFSLIGRYGLRVGDRVTVSGVTGDVLEIGLVRIYLLEITGAGGDLHTSGRVVGFSNSVVFQPAALFKQLPGTDYVWRTVALTLEPDTDLQLAESRLMAAVGTVYDQYRERIEQQHAALQRLVDLPMPPPQPEGGLRFTTAGLEFYVRYPVEMRQAPATDGQVIKALCDAIAREPRLALARSGTPKLQGAV